MTYKPGQRVTCPLTGLRGRVVFVSPVTQRIYLEFGRQMPFVTYSLAQLGDLFAPL